MPLNANRRISVTAMAEIEAAWLDNRAAVEASDLSQSSQATYIDMANQFIRWLRASFDSGSRRPRTGLSQVGSNCYATAPAEAFIPEACEAVDRADLHSRFSRPHDALPTTRRTRTQVQ
jgi:hypothetical protein